MSWKERIGDYLGIPQVKLQVVPVPTYKVIEIRPHQVQAWSKELKDAIKTLSSHPGFVAILDRLALQKQLLANKASLEFHKDIRELDYLQAGIFWLGYIQTLLDKVTEVPRQPQRDIMQEELEAFQEIDRQLERVGGDPQGQK
jgi:hypothetical protein